MAEFGTKANDGGGGGGGAVEAGEFGDVKSLLSGEGRDFLLRNNGDKVSISSLQGGIFGLYFSASWCGPCRSFTPKLADVYSELSSRGSGLEVIFVSGDMDEDSFNGYFTKMPWLAIPFSDSDARKQLNKLFNVYGIPHLVILDANGKVLNEDGVEIVEELGVDGYPFTLEKHNELLEAAEAAKREQTLQSVLVSPSRDYVILNDGTKVAVSDLEGKIVAIYFAVSGYPPSAEFTPILAQIYEKLKEKGEKFEVVLVSLDEDESSFAESFSSMPWFALPFGDKNRERLTRYFELHRLPFVVVIGGDGKTMNVDFAEIVEEHGVDALQAFPFDQEKLDLLADKARAKIEAKGWPEKMKHELHEEHELVLLRCPRYCCDACNEMGAIWSYRCKDCDFDLHPECALKESKDESGELVENHEETSKDGYVCDGDVCRKL